MDPVNVGRVIGTPVPAAAVDSKAQSTDAGEFTLQLEGAEAGQTEASQVLLSEAARKSQKLAIKQAQDSGLLGAPGVQIQPLAAAPVPVPTADTKAAAFARAGETLAERLPETQAAAISLDTAGNLFATQPWSKDWVFHPSDARNPNLKPLIGEAPKVEANPAEASALQQLMRELKSVEGQVDREIDLSQNRIAQINSASPSDADSVSRLLAQMSGEISGEAAFGDQPKVDQPKVETGKTDAAYSGISSGADYLATRQAVKQVQNGKSQFGGLNQGQPGPGTEQITKLKARPTDTLADSFPTSMQSFVARPQDGIAPSLLQSGAAIPVVTGHATQGSMMRDRLASESLRQMTNQIASISTRGPGFQNGEMRIRLKPEDLGELHVRVMTQGNQVGLQIHASDERAKKLIEESLVHLKDSMAAQNLVLSKADVGVASAASSPFSQDMMGDQRQQQQNQQSQQQSSAAWNAAQDGASQRGSQDGRNARGTDESGTGGLAAGSRSRSRGMDVLNAINTAARAPMVAGRLDVTA